MSRKLNPNAIGSDVEAFLASEGLLEDADAYALKRVLAWQLAQAMKEQRVSKSSLALRMKTSRPVVDRLLSASSGVTLDTVTRAASALGLRTHVTFERARPAAAPRVRSKTESRPKTAGKGSVGRVRQPTRN